MFIKFFQDGEEKTLRVPIKINHSMVEIKNMKKVICVIVRKKCLKETKQIKLKRIGISLLEDKISLSMYCIQKQKIKSRNKKTFIVKLKKDVNSLVKIQRDLF